MKAISTPTPVKKNLLAAECTFNWYLVKTKTGENQYKALPFAYGVIYIGADDRVTFSTREFFNSNYDVIDRINSLTVTFQD